MDASSAVQDVTLPPPFALRPPGQGWVIDSGRTASSNASAERRPSPTAASFRVIPSAWAFLATLAALS